MAARWLSRQTRRPARLWIAGGVACAAVAAAAVYLLDASSTDAAVRPASADAGRGKADPSAAPGGPGSVLGSAWGSGAADPNRFDKSFRLIRPRERTHRSAAAEDGAEQDAAPPPPTDELVVTVPPAGDPPDLPKLELGDLSPLPLVDEQTPGLDGIGALDGLSATYGGDATVGAGLAGPLAGAIGVQASGSAAGADVQFGVRLNFGADRPIGGTGGGAAAGLAGGGAASVDASGLAGGAGLGGLGGQVTSTVSGATDLIGH